jgi:hypothetical protein
MMASKQQHGIDELLASSSLAIGADPRDAQEITDESVASVLERRADARSLELLDAQLTDIASPPLDFTALRDVPEENTDGWATFGEQKSREI